MTAEHGIFSRHGDSGWELLLVLIGFGLMMLALIPGARFWFGLLSRLTNALGLLTAWQYRHGLVSDQGVVCDDLHAGVWLHV